MSAFWSWWIMGLVVFNMGLTFFLFLWAPRAKVPVLPDGTTGHVWAHGVLREGLANLPRWWIVMSFSMFIAGFIYLYRYPGFGAHKGSLGWTARGELAADTAANDKKLSAAMKGFSSKSIEQLSKDDEAVGMGEVLFRDNCAACHGRDARGNHLLGAPNLVDHDWLYGGDGNAILTSILDGRHGAMPAWGAQFKDADIANLANYVRSLAGQPHDKTKAAAGKELFTVCAACHGPDGHGNTAIGAPNLTGTVRLYGGDLETLETTIRDGRGGTMPSWRERLGEDKARVIAAYVYLISHGGSTATQ